MSDISSDFDDNAPQESDPIVVEIRGHGTQDSPMTVRRAQRPQHRNPSRASQRHLEDEPSNEHSESDEDLTDDDEGEDDDLSVEAPTSRSTRRPHTSRNIKTANGKKPINMTPPNRLLEKAIKRAAKLSALKKADIAIKKRIEILALTKIVFEEAHWKVAEAHVSLAEDYLELKGYNVQAEFHTECAMKIMSNSVTTTTTEQEKADVFSVLFKLNYILGKSQLALKKYAEADKALMKADCAYQACSKLSCVTHDQCYDMEMQLALVTARLSWKQKKYAVAGTQYDKVIDLTKRRFGDNAVELIDAYQACGQLEQSKGKHANNDKAIDMFLQAHHIAVKNFKYASEEIVDTALALAQAYSSTGREEAESSAESYLNECLSACTSLHGPYHKKTLQVQDELARLLIRTGRESDAMEMLRSSLPLKNETYGEYSECVSDTYKLVASIYLAQGNIEKALRYYQKCQNIEVIVLGKNHKKTKDTESTIGILVVSPGLSKKFVLNQDEKLKKRPRFNAFSKTAKFV